MKVHIAKGCAIHVWSHIQITKGGTKILENLTWILLDYNEVYCVKLSLHTSAYDFSILE